MNDELKPCPFCGSDAVTDFVDDLSYLIECNICACQTCSCDSKEEAIAAWNRRATPPSPSTAPIAEDERAALPKPYAWSHTMDNTEGLKGNKPHRVLMFSKRSPFGRPGIDFSESYPVTAEALFTADQLRAYGQECARAALASKPVAIDGAPQLSSGQQAEKGEK